MGESFTIDYDLPNRTAYAETCAAISLAMFAERMLKFGADSRYSDIIERTMYNGIMSGISLDGKSFFYENPLEITTGFDRPNLFFGVIKSSSKDEKLIDLIRERGDRSGIVYCATRKNVESVCELLCDNGCSAGKAVWTGKALAAAWDGSNSDADSWRFLPSCELFTPSICAAGKSGTKKPGTKPGICD